MKAHFALRALLTAAALLALAGTAAAQQQPLVAENQQDEVVNIDLPANADLDDVLRILRSDDKLETNRYVTRAFELFNTTPIELLLTVRQAVEQEDGVVRGAVTNAQGTDAPQRFFLVVTTTAEQMPSIAETIAALDIPAMVSSQGSARKAIRVKYRRASDLAQVLRNTRLSSAAKTYADDLTNSLFYEDSPYVIDRTEEYTRFFDVPIPQVEFDVQIIEVREDQLGRLGLDWDAWKRTLGGQIGFTGNYFEGGEQFGRVDALLTLDATVLAQFLNYTVQTGSANLVQRSRLTASNLRPAIISDRRRVPYQEYVRTAQAGSLLTEANVRVDSSNQTDADDPDVAGPRVVAITPPVVNRLTEIGAGDEGIFISIQPVIGTEAVTADVRISVNTVTGVDQLGRPIVTLQDLTNQFTLVNGRDLLLGTLERETRTEARSGIPGLKDIPVVKYLFSVETTRSQRSRLFILANPTFRDVGFGAGDLVDAKTMPLLSISERELILEDENIVEAPELAPVNP